MALVIFRTLLGFFMDALYDQCEIKLSTWRAPDIPTHMVWTIESERYATLACSSTLQGGNIETLVGVAHFITVERNLNKCYPHGHIWPIKCGTISNNIKIDA